MRYDTEGEWIVPELSRHAEERRRQMELSIDEVLLVVADCEVSYQQNDYDNNGVVFKRDDVSVVVDEDSNKIVTILWNQQEDYER